MFPASIRRRWLCLFFRVPDCKLQDRSWNDVKLFEGIAQPMTDHGTGTFTFTYTNQPFVWENISYMDPLGKIILPELAAKAPDKKVARRRCFPKMGGQNTYFLVLC